MDTMSKSLPPNASPEDRLASLWASRLEASAGDLPPDIAERLRFSRERALARSRVARAQAAALARPAVEMAPAWAGVPQGVLAGAGAAAGAGVGAGFWGFGGPLGPSGIAGRIAALLPLAILCLGLLTIQGVLREWQIEAAAEVDAALLADDLPPQAYTDPGFAEFLRREGR